MHAIIVISAVAVTSGLFGGGRATCTSGQCGAATPQVQGYQYTYTPTASSGPQVQGAQYASTVYYYPQAQGSPNVSAAYSGPGYVYSAVYTQPAAPAEVPATPGATVATPSQVYYYTYPTVTVWPNRSRYRR